MQWIERLLRFFFPTACILCGKGVPLNENRLCPQCAAQPPVRLRRNYNLQYRRRGYVLFCYAPAQYRGYYRKTLHRFKFSGETALAAPLAARMATALPQDYIFDCIVPVPLHKTRQQERGYNQSLLLAERLAQHVQLPVLQALEKVRENRVQHRLSAEEREKNVRGVYRAEPVEGLRILLVDDIVTTGATARACAAELYRAGAADVVCVAAALV